MPDIEDIDRLGGWLVRVITRGNPPIERHFYAYDLDPVRAVTLVRAYAPVTHGEGCEAVRALPVHELTGNGMQPGEVKQHA